jgi:hypothetical protein
VGHSLESIPKGENMSSRITSALVACATMLVMVASARSQVAYQIVGGTPATSVNSQTVGWTFLAATDMCVDALGVYDFGGDGLAEPHEVGLWSSDYVELARVEVTNTPLDSGFRYSPVPPVWLQPGEWYFVGAFYNVDSPDPFLFTDIVVDLAPAIAQTLPSFALAPSLLIPDNVVYDGRPLFAGPNLRFATMIPEPATLGAVAGIALVAMRRRR